MKLPCQLDKMLASPLSPKLDNPIRYQRGFCGDLYVILLPRLPTTETAVPRKKENDGMREDQAVRSPVACLKSDMFETVRPVDSSEQGLATVKEENEPMSEEAGQIGIPKRANGGMMRRAETCERDPTAVINILNSNMALAHRRSTQKGFYRSPGIWRDDSYQGDGLEVQAYAEDHTEEEVARTWRKKRKKPGESNTVPSDLRRHGDESERYDN